VDDGVGAIFPPHETTTIAHIARTNSARLIVAARRKDHAAYRATGARRPRPAANMERVFFARARALPPDAHTS
jgi:hypothetical protein